jgi:heme a synthase
VHFAHRVGAILVTSAILAAAGRVWFHHRGRRELVRPAMLLVLFVLTQVSLGAFVIWSGLQPVVNTAHVVNGALVLATSLVLTLRSFRYRFAELPRTITTASPVAGQTVLTRSTAGSRQHI